MAQNLTRSSSGTLGSSASCSTRSLKSSQESSRLKYRELSSRSGVGGAATGGGASAIRSWPTSVLWSDSARLVMDLRASAGRSMLDERIHGRVRPGARVAEQIEDAGSDACYQQASGRGRRAATRH